MAFLKSHKNEQRYSGMRASNHEKLLDTRPVFQTDEKFNWASPKKTKGMFTLNRPKIKLFTSRGPVKSHFKRRKKVGKVKRRVDSAAKKHRQQSTFFVIAKD